MRVRPRSGGSPNRLILVILALTTALTVTPNALAQPTRTPIDATATADPLGWRAIAAALNDPNVTWTLCAKQNSFCSFKGKMMVRYGLPGTYAYRLSTDGVWCTNNVFGNPRPGVTKYCAYRPWSPATISPTEPVSPRPIVPVVTEPATTVPPVATVPPATTPPATTPATTPTPTTPAPVPTTAAPVPTIPATTVPTTAAPAPLPLPLGPIAPIPSNFNVAPYLSTGQGIPASTANEPSGNFRTVCNFSHLAYDDPIVYPGQPGASHLHMFFGNTGTNANTTYQSLRTTGEGTCQGGALNRSAYWAPAVINAGGKVVIPDFAGVYYKGMGTTASIGQVKAMPPGLRMIAGYNMAAPGGATHYDWNCELTERKQQTVPSCPTGERVGVVIRFPSCWDGKNLDSADHRSHMAYTVGHDFSGVCPASHPVHLPDYTLGFWFPNDGNSANWKLDSDTMPGMTHANGSTFHSDWFGGWDPVVQATWVRECINEMRDCKGGQLGDGTQLSTSYSYPDKPHAGATTITKPIKG